MMEQQGLQDRVTLLLKDYRDLEGQYDKLVSVEMIEAVGYRFLPVYFNKLEELLKPKGRLLIQAITIADAQFDQYRKGVDFIQRYIFPGGCLPSIREMCKQLQTHTSMRVTRMKDYGQDYAETLALWSRNFKTHARKLKESGYDDDFQRLWNFYFAYCEGGFREGSIGLVHFEAAKP
jgi:cyclopropane-fatty-acyl-phospholipid synthase